MVAVGKWYTVACFLRLKPAMYRIAHQACAAAEDPYTADADSYCGRTARGRLYNAGRFVLGWNTQDVLLRRLASRSRQQLRLERLVKEMGF